MTTRTLLVATALVLAAAPLAARPRTINKPDLLYRVTIPSECRTEEGPGTLEAICSPDLDEAKSVDIPAAAALLLEIDVEIVPAGAARYGEAEFRQEVPEAVCGEADNPKIKLDAVKITKNAGTDIFSASVTCPEIKFLGLPERTAELRYVVAPGYRYRLMGRALSSDQDKVKAAVAAFLASFKTTAESKP